MRIKMSYNLALLAPDEKQKIELEKQASYAVWKVKNGFSDRWTMDQKAQAMTDENERTHFLNCIKKHEEIMG